MEQEKRLTFGEHLEELRFTIVFCLVAVVTGMISCFVLHDELLAIIILPIQRLGLRLQSLQVTEPFVVALKVALVGGIFVSFPFVAYFLWDFVGCGLLAHERKAVKTYAPFSVVLFLLGAVFSYAVVLPVGLEFLTTFLSSPWIENGIHLSSYLSFFLLLTVVIGLAFELPLVMLFLQGIGAVDVAGLKRLRRHAVLTSFVVAAVFTPPDPITQVSLAIAIVVLYEVGIILGRFRQMRKAKTAPVPS